MNDLVIVPSPVADSPWTEVSDEVKLARSKQGRVYEKQILRFGELSHPLTGQKILIDDAFAQRLLKNFDDGVCDIVQVPLANDKNEHVESPAANLGEVLGLRVDSVAGKVFARVDARADAEKFGKTYLGASAFMHLNYLDNKTGKNVGPTLLHVAVTNRPYVTGLDPYQEIVAASAEYQGEPALLEMSALSDVEEVVVPRSLAEILVELKSDHGLDVTDLQTKLTAAETEKSVVEVKLTEASAALAEKPDVDELVEKVKIALKGTDVDQTKLTSGEVTADDIVAAVATLAQDNVRLTSTADSAIERVAALEKINLSNEIDGLVSQGLILPAKREAFLSLALSNRAAFDAVLPDEPLVKLNDEQGVGQSVEDHQKQEIDVEAEIARLTGGPAAQYVGV